MLKKNNVNDTEPKVVKKKYTQIELFSKTFPKDQNLPIGPKYK